MVTAGEGASAPTSSTYEGGGGGAGGKFSKRQFRKTRTTPYDRPPTDLRNPSWLSKLVVDPATKLITSGAQRFFASVFPKRLPPPPTPPPPSELNQELSDGLQGAVQKNQAEAPEAVGVDSHNLTIGANSGISELEQLLKQKTLSKSEIDRLTELLRSRAADSPVENDVKRTEANLSKPATNFENHQLLKSPLVETRTETERSHGVISTPGISARVLEDDVASPAELARAYMGRRPSKESPSILGLRSQAIRQDTTLLSNVPFTPKSPIVSLATRTASHLEVSENGFTTPRTRGRSAIYNMARTPYSRVHSTAFGKGSRSRSHGYDGYLLPSSTLQELHGEHEPKVALKRRSSVLDDDLGSVGPMRRIRQKHNLLPHRLSASTRGTGGASDTAQQPPSLTQKLPSMENWRQKGLRVVRETEDNGTPSTSYGRVPPKSTEMAAKILQHLERMTPKEKSAESKLVAAREKSPTKLTTDMLRGQALRSLEDAEPLKLLQNVQGSQRMEDRSSGSSTNLDGSTFQKQERVEENGPKKIDIQRDMLTLSATSDPAASVKDITPSTEASDAATKYIAQHPQKKKQAFMMSAHEDSLELDDDTYCDGPASESFVDGSGKLETPVTDKNSACAEKQVQNQIPSLPDMKKTPPEPIFSRTTDEEIGNNIIVGGERAGVAFPALHMSSTTSQSVTHTPSASAFEKPRHAIHKIPAFDNNSLPSVTEFSGPRHGFWMQQKPQGSTSTGQVTDLPLEVPVSGKKDDNNSQEATKPKGKPEIPPSFAFSSSSSSSISSSILPDNPDPKNGPLGISPSTYASSPALASTVFANQLLTDSTSTVVSSTTSITTSAALTWISATSSSSPLVSTLVPSFSDGPIFGSGSSHSATITVSSVLRAPDVEASDMKTKMEKEAKTSSSSNSFLGGASSAIASTGSSIFGLGSSNASSIAKCQSQGTGSESVLSMQPSVTGSGAATVSQSIPFQFGSSASSSVFGTSGVASFASSNPLFSSSTPATKLFSSGASFSLGSSSTLSDTKPVGSGSGGSSSVFSFGASASASTSDANAVSSSSGATTNTFFGASSSATSSMTNTVSSSRGATPGIFSFGASSSSGNNMVSSGAGAGAGASSGMFGISSMSSSSVTNSASSSSAPSTVFGSSWQTPKSSSPFGATFTSSPSTGFSFGASSSSFPAPSTASMVFGSSNGFSFTAAPATTSFSPSPFPTQPMFGNSTSTFTSPGNNDHMSTEDSMAEDPVQSSTPAVPGFGQQPVSPSPAGFVFGSAVSQSSSPFQFGGQQSQGTLQNTSPFQASGSLEFNAGGSFSLGSGGLGGDKSGRKIVKVNRNRHRKK